MKIKTHKIPIIILGIGNENESLYIFLGKIVIEIDLGDNRLIPNKKRMDNILKQFQEFKKIVIGALKTKDKK